MYKQLNQKAWFLVAPVVALVAFNAIIPLMTVVNFSVQETFGDNVFFWAGVDWFEQVLHSSRFHDALLRQILFTAIILLIEVPLGLIVALAMPRKGPWVSVCLVTMALPLLIPWNVVGAMWNIFALPEIGLMGKGLRSLGFDFNYTRQPLTAWFTVVLMDVWHWTSLVVLLCYAGLVSIPNDYYQAAKIDGASAWSVFRYIQLPKLKRVLTIAILLRFMDSFMIYTEVVVLTGGGPGNSTTFLSIDLVKMALGQFDLGPAAAMSLIYFLIILLLSWLFYTVMTRNEAR
ncbi:carbohydrate ABC transporter permease [Dongia deserti]|uniref:carbohydrate ABC transporter permease n=1 Tax=Dongia deserti TaxID=2268030 RepID=UPI000E64AF63|nr:sugar ABC transporter permease [Dongia deserti]